MDAERIDIVYTLCALIGLKLERDASGLEERNKVMALWNIIFQENPEFYSKNK